MSPKALKPSSLQQSTTSPTTEATNQILASAFAEPMQLAHSSRMIEKVANHSRSAWALCTYTDKTMAMEVGLHQAVIRSPTEYPSRPYHFACMLE